jgi:hypothetical protein
MPCGSEYQLTVSVVMLKRADHSKWAGLRTWHHGHICCRLIIRDINIVYWHVCTYMLDIHICISKSPYIHILYMYIYVYTYRYTQGHVMFCPLLHVQVDVVFFTS